MKRLAALLAGAMLLVGMATTANALSVKYSTDGGATYSADITGPGFVVATPTIAGFDFANIVVTTNHKPNSSALFTTTIDTATSGPASLYLLISDTYNNLTIPGTGVNAYSALNLLSFGKSADLETFYGTALFDQTNLIADMDVNTLGVHENNTTLMSMTNPFTLTELIMINFDQAATAQVSATLNLTPVPEPGTMMLLGAGFLGLAIYGKRRKNA
jgi:hypothetical protein